MSLHRRRASSGPGRAAAWGLALAALMATAGGPKIPRVAAQDVPCRVGGTVRLAGRTHHEGVTVSLDGAEVAVSNAEGDFAIAAVPSGNHRLAAAAPGYLSVVATGVACRGGAPATLAEALLPGGDANGDDAVDVLDLVIVAAAYGTCAGGPGFDPRADMNATDCADMFDLVLLGSSYGTSGPVAWPPGAAEAPTFASDIAPLLETHCVVCHGQAGGLALDDYSAVMAGGDDGPVVVPGDPEASELYLTITGRSRPAMPPGGPPLSPGDTDLIRAWIEAGAPGPSPR